MSGDALPNDGGDEEEEDEEEEDEDEDEAMKLPAEREPDFPEEEVKLWLPVRTSLCACADVC